MKARMALVVLALAAPAGAQDPKKRPGMDYGPFLAASFISRPGAKFDNGTGNFDCDVTARGIAVKLAEGWDAGIIFDSDTLRMSAGWIGGPLKLTGVIFDGAHGPSPTLGVPPLFQTPNGPGWAKEGSFDDPRPDSIKPLPRPGRLLDDWGRYRGLYLAGSRVILSYTVGACEILESPGLEEKAIVRTFRVGASTRPLELRVAEDAAGTLQVAAAGLPEGAKLVASEGRHRLQLPERAAPSLFKLFLCAGDPAEIVKASAPAEDLSAMRSGGPGRWTTPIATRGTLGAAPGAYVVDTLTLPTDNPWRAKMRVGGFDFFEDGTGAALCTWDGDVWIVTGIDAGLEKLAWRRFATGLHQPLGLKIVDGKIYTVGHDQITRLHDLDGDGEADFYENFNNDWELTTAFHSFCFDLHTDAQGNFYFAFNSPVRSGGGGFHRITPHQGCILKVSKDGTKLETFATGFRANNGIGVGPNGEVTSGDNEGTWVPKCPLHWVKPGSFNGVVDSAHREMKSAKGKPDASEQPKPICWMPKEIDNSGGGQVWVTSDRWGPFRGQLLHLSYGTSSLFKVLMEEVEGQKQGGVVRFPLRFTSGTMRGRFNPKDGQLYVSGLRGWQSNAAKEGGLDRVRYTGAAANMPTGLRATKKGVAIEFTDPLDRDEAAKTDNYGVRIWNYRWTSGYGSGHYSTVDAPPGEEKKKGKEFDVLEVQSAAVSADGKSVFLEVPGIKPVMQMKISMRLKAADGSPVSHDLHNTIHALGND